VSCFGNREKPERICPVSKCFPQVSHLWEVSGYRCRKNEDGIEDRLVQKTTITVSCFLRSVFVSPFFILENPNVRHLLGLLTQA